MDYWPVPIGIAIIGIYGEPDKPETIEIKDGEIKDNVKIRVTKFYNKIKENKKKE